MFWYLLLMLFSPLYLMFGLVFRGEQARLVLALHHQVLVLQRQLGKRPSLVPGERLALVLSSRLLGKAKLKEALLIVKPETLVGWHRAIVRRHCSICRARPLTRIRPKAISSPARCSAVSSTTTAVSASNGVLGHSSTIWCHSGAAGVAPWTRQSALVETRESFETAPTNHSRVQVRL